MNIKTYAPIEELKPYVRMLWVMNVDKQAHDTDLKTIPTSGNPKIIIPVQTESLVLSMGQQVLFLEKYKSIIVGQQISPAIVDCSQNTKAFGIELCPIRAYRLLGHTMTDFTNCMTSIDVVFGNLYRQLSQEIYDSTCDDEILAVLQKYLLKLLHKSYTQSLIVEYVAESILKHNGQLSIIELSKKTGYTQRYIDKIFKRDIGISPKVFANITRFNLFYKKIYAFNSIDELKDDLYEFYYDQAHFIREFRKFSGSSPTQILKQHNSIGELFLSIYS